tara:strand:+ start:234 stop:803 length:570 start_codon:yes stop_codon:yes gene_type:complete
MNGNQVVNYFFSRAWNVSFIFFTTWSLLIQAFYYFGVFKKYQESVLFITISVAFIGAVLTYVYPRRIILKHVNVEINGLQLQILDLICHQLPLILLLLFYEPSIKPDNLLFAAIVILVYVLIYNPMKVYNFDKNLNNVSNENKNSILNIECEGCKPSRFLTDRRYHVATFMLLAYFILVILSVKMNVFK